MPFERILVFSRLNVNRNAIKAIVVSALLLAINSTFLPANAAGVAKGCVQPKVQAIDLGKLIVAGQISQVPSVAWGIQAGCFQKYGITVDYKTVASTQIGMSGLIGGTYDLVLNTPTNLIQIVGNSGLDLKFIAPRHGYSRPELDRAKKEPLYPGELLLQSALIVKKDSPIKSWSDLANKKIAIQSINSADHAGTLLAIKNSGGSSKKTQFVVVPSAQMELTLNKGDVDAVIPNDPFASQILINGGRIIGYPNAYYAEPGAAVVYAALSDNVAKKRLAFKAFQKAVLESNKLMNLPENENSFRDLIATITNVTPQAAAKLRLPVMEEQNLSFSEIAYIPRKLKQVGFTDKRVNLTPLLFW